MLTVPKPTREELEHWNSLVPDVAEGRVYYETPLTERVGVVGVPAQQVGDTGGLRWKERVFTNDKRQDRKKRQRSNRVCAYCSRNFPGTCRARFCDDKCRISSLRKGNGKLPIDYERYSAWDTKITTLMSARTAGRTTRSR